MSTPAKRGVLTHGANWRQDGSLEAFCARQVSRIHDRVNTLHQRHQRRASEHAQLTYAADHFETRGLPQPWNRSTKDHRL